jgi:hypothetical protein
MFGSPYYGNQTCEKDTTGGSGRFNAQYTTDPTLPEHTIYAPKFHRLIQKSYLSLSGEMVPA